MGVDRYKVSRAYTRHPAVVQGHLPFAFVLEHEDIGHDDLVVVGKIGPSGFWLQTFDDMHGLHDLLNGPPDCLGDGGISFFLEVAKMVLDNQFEQGFLVSAAMHIFTSNGFFMQVAKLNQ